MKQLFIIDLKDYDPNCGAREEGAGNIKRRLNAIIFVKEIFKKELLYG